jgi:protein SCO1/2
MIKKSYIISIVVIVSFLGISATWVISKANESINELPAVIKKVPDFSMTSHIGENFNQDSLLNKISILDFIFTSCPGPCPVMSNNMRTLYRQYKLHPDLQFISISVDPEYDTQEVLKNYADANGVNDERWKFLRAGITGFNISLSTCLIDFLMLLFCSFFSDLIILTGFLIFIEVLDSIFFI